MKTISAMLLSAVALSPLAVHAADSNWYALVSVGQSTYDVDKSDLDGTINGLGLNVGSSKLDDTDTGYKIQAGYKFSENLAVEGGYVDFGRASYGGDAVPGSGITSLHLGADVKAYGFNVDAVGTLPVGAGFSVFAKAGAIITHTEITASVTASGLGGTASEDGKDTETGLSPSLGAGLTFDLNDSLSVRLEYQRFFALKTSGDNGDDIDADLASLGLVVRF